MNLFFDWGESPWSSEATATKQGLMKLYESRIITCILKPDLHSSLLLLSLESLTSGYFKREVKKLVMLQVIQNLFLFRLIFSYPCRFSFIFFVIPDDRNVQKLYRYHLQSLARSHQLVSLFPKIGLTSFLSSSFYIVIQTRESPLQLSSIIVPRHQFFIHADYAPSTPLSLSAKLSSLNHACYRMVPISTRPSSFGAVYFNKIDRCQITQTEAKRLILPNLATETPHLKQNFPASLSNTRFSTLPISSPQRLAPLVYLGQSHRLRHLHQGLPANYQQNIHHPAPVSGHQYSSWYNPY